MAEKKSMISQLQAVGEDAIGKVASSEAARSAMKSAMQLKDKAAKSLTGLEAVEKRLEAIEKRLAALERDSGKEPAEHAAAGKSSSTGAKSRSSSGKSSASKAKPEED